MANPLRVNASELLRRPGSQKTVELTALQPGEVIRNLLESPTTQR